MNKTLKLIVENNIECYDVIVEQENPNKPKQVRVRGPYVVAEEKNANGRKYNRAMMESCIAKYDKEKIQTGRAYGELGHPENVAINHDRVCHRIISLTQDGNKWIGESIITIGTPCGDILKGLLLSGGKVGFSTRGVGEITNEGIVSEFNLITVDSVLDPSGPGCFADGILESKQYMIDTHGDIIEVAYNKLEKSLSNIPNKEAQKYVQESIMNFINSIKN